MPRATGSRQNEEKEISPSSGGKQSGDEREISQATENPRFQSAVVVSLTPPTLRFCDDLLSLLLFLDKFEEYSRLGEKLRCISVFTTW